ncbi:MAG: hypothetical protein ABIQ74_06615 [Chitinophagales bacterium]
MNSLTEMEYRILDELYFLSSFESVIENLGESKDLIIAGMKHLLENELIIQVKMNAGKEEKLETPDYPALEKSFFVASKKGLILHNSIN